MSRRDDTEAGHDPGADPGSGRLAVWRIGFAGGLAGMLCCVGPTVLALIGVIGAGTAYTWATDLYDGYAWWFRLAGLTTIALLVGLSLRRRNQCDLAGLRRWRHQLRTLAIIASGTYAILYAVTTWLGTLT